MRYAVNNNADFKSLYMDKPKIVAEARQLIAEGRIEEALDSLLAFLQNKIELRPIYTLALQAKSLLEKTQSDEAQGLISYENVKINYNQVTKQTLQLLDNWETGALPDVEKPTSAFRWWWVALPVGIIGLAIAIWTILTPPPPISPEEFDCPFAQDSSFKVLVLPFKPLGDTIVTPNHKFVQERLSNYSEQFGIDASVKIYEINPNEDNLYPSNTKEAAQIANTCSAKLIIWGSTVKEKEIEVVKTRFKFLNLGDNFQFLKLNVTEGTDIDTLSSLSSISTEGILTERIENTMKLLFGLIAHQTNNDKVAAEFLAQAETTDSMGILLKGMTLAGINAAAGESEKALASLNEVIETHPDYALARNNRASLLYVKGDYVEAANDLKVVIDQQPENKTARAVRAAAYIKSNQLEKAARDIEALENTQPLDSVTKSGKSESINAPADVKPSELDKLRKDYQDKVKTEELRKDKAENILRENPDNKKALNTKAETSANLGDYRTAAATAQRLIQSDPTNVRAYATLIESANALRNTDTVKATIDKARKMGITKEKLIEVRPALKEILSQKKQ